MELYYLAYISYASNTCTEQSLDRLLKNARIYNESYDITGILLKYNDRFIQVLEGKKELVKSLFERINESTNHYGALIISEGILEKRNFGKWSMAYEKVISEDLESVPELNLLSNLIIDKETMHHPTTILLRMFQVKNIK